MHNVVLVDAVRSPVGRFQGVLADVRPDDLAAHVIASLVERVGLDATSIDEVFMGCANQAGEDNRNVARMATLLAGLPYDVPAVTVNRLCASGLEAVNQAARSIQVGDAEVCIAGGVESMSRAPYTMPRGPQHPKAGNVTIWDTALGWRYPNPRLAERFPLEAMGCTAENILARTPYSREDQDAFALKSHQKAVAAQDAGWFASEIAPITVKVKRDERSVDQDEAPRRDTNMERLGKLRPVFREGGSVTAGNSSPLNDGAAAVLVMREDRALAMGLKPRARIVSKASSGVDPEVMGLGPVPASRRALERAGLTVGDIDVWEINEAFAAQSLAVMGLLGLTEERVNLHGGAIALGHPLGCSGARILTTLLSVMERVDATHGVATLCVGVGQGVATVIERM